MKKQKCLKSAKSGFTLVELIAVIVLLSVIATLAIVSVSTIKNKVNEREYVNLASTIESAAQGYAEETGVGKMFVQTLVDKGLVETDDETKQVYDPRDSSSLNCHIINIKDGEATLSENKDTTCDPTLLSDDAIKIQYTLATDATGVKKDLPVNDYWFNQSIVLSVRTTGNVDLNLEGATYKWTSPLAPDKTYSTPELRIDDKYVNDTYQVTITAGGRKYTAYGKVKIDREPPKVFNLIDTKPEDWSPNKTLQFELSDAESGIQAYQISLDGNTEPTTWIKVNPVGKKNDKQTVTKNLASMREGENVYVWVKDMVGNVNKSDVSADGGDGAIQINNIDGVFDSVTLTGSPSNSTYTQSVSLTGTAKDLKSGLVGWVCSSSKTAPSSTSSQWKKVTKTNDQINITCPNPATANGEYYLHAIDAVGNVGTATYKVTNIDREINYVNITDTQSGYREYSTLRGTAYDTKAGIVGYAFSNSSAKPSRFNSITRTNSTITYTYTADRNTTYYFHVIDQAGNWSYDYVTPTNIVREQVYRGQLYSERSSYISDNFRLSGAVAITDYYTDTGYISASLSGSYAYVNASGGRTYEQSYWDTCYSRAGTYSADYEMKCSGSYRCNRGGYVRGEMCTGRDYTLTSNPRERQTYTCSGGSWHMTSGRWPGTPCDTGYYRTGNNDAFNCNNPKGSCKDGATQTVMYACQARCYWSGDYPASCGGSMYRDYYCDRGDYLSGSTCYYCSGYGEYFNSRTRQCEYDCKKYYDYWQYNVTIYYYVLKY